MRSSNRIEVQGQFQLVLFNIVPSSPGREFAAIRAMHDKQPGLDAMALTLAPTLRRFTSTIKTRMIANPAHTNGIRMLDV